MLVHVFFLYGLAFFAMGLAVALESRRASALAFGHHLRWLAAFGLAHSIVEWSDMFMLLNPPEPLHGILQATRTIMLPLSALLLVRFGIGLVGEAGPLPEWLTLIPPVLLVPGALLVTYGIVVALTDPVIETAADVWSRYLLYLPGSLLASFGFVRQWRSLLSSGYARAGYWLLGAALGFAFNALVAGLIVPSAPYGLAPWLNYDRVLALTGTPVQVWRALSALAVAFFVVGALGVFEAERERRITRLNAERAQAQQEALRVQSEARQSAEEWTDSLVSISRKIANLDNVDDVLSAIVAGARRLLATDLAALALWDSAGEQLELKCYATDAGARLSKNMGLAQDPHIDDAIRARRTARYPQAMDGNQPVWRCPISQQAIQSAIIVPLQLDERVWGGLWVERYTSSIFTDADQQGLERLADQSVIALEHALMASRMQSLAVIEERARIARELHDGVAQVLGYLSLEMQTLEALVRQGHAQDVLPHLVGARQRIKEAQADTREGILSLRTTLAGDVGLIPALQAYIDEFSVQTALDARLVHDLPDAPHLSPLAEAQLVRIVQEALTNVRKHARARRVSVNLSVGLDRLHVAVRDDGVGFGGNSEHGHFGLQTMHERALSVNGALQVTSQPNHGTCVDVWLPLMER
ncbi:MAG: GAF domain-containing protein [Chloroflexi bacterium]|nr:GAF domain-containing protein [Chloroflexota bacterium]